MHKRWKQLFDGARITPVVVMLRMVKACVLYLHIFTKTNTYMKLKNPFIFPKKLLYLSNYSNFRTFLFPPLFSLVGHC